MVVHVRTPTWRYAVYVLVLWHIILHVDAQNSEGRQSLDKVDEKASILVEKDKRVQDESVLREKVGTCDTLLTLIHAFRALK